MSVKSTLLLTLAIICCIQVASALKVKRQLPVPIPSDIPDVGGSIDLGSLGQECQQWIHSVADMFMSGTGIKGQFDSLVDAICQYVPIILQVFFGFFGSQ